MYEKGERDNKRKRWETSGNRYVYDVVIDYKGLTNNKKLKLRDVINKFFLVSSICTPFISDSSILFLCSIYSTTQSRGN